MARASSAPAAGPHLAGADDWGGRGSRLGIRIRDQRQRKVQGWRTTDRGREKQMGVSLHLSELRLCDYCAPRRWIAEGT